MRKRRLGRTDLELTPVGLGTWAIGGPDWRYGWGPQDDAAAVAAVVRGVEAGINWIDTAAVYGAGHAEELVGRALAQLGPAARPLVSTKCGRIVEDDGTVRGVLHPQSILAECDASRRRLGVDVLDLYQIHWPDPDADIEGAWTALVDLKEAGAVRHIGVSNFSVAQLRRVQAIHPVASLQPPYSMVERDTERDLLPYCGEQVIGVVAYSPMGRGLLTGAFSRERAASLPANDHRSRDPDFAPPRLDVHLSLVQQLQQLATQHGRTAAQLAIAWVLRRPEITSAIAGVRTPAQVEGLADAGSWDLDDDTVAAVERLLADHARALQQLRGNS
jgi:aryl-alcohol dehydrogenase-like predicted oxidoreductase